MNIPLQKLGIRVFGTLMKLSLVLCALLCIPESDLRAEGSKDFVSDGGNRLFLDTRDPQQMKVFVRQGEFINVGASHVGINGGFIRVFKPDGSVAMTFDGSNGLAIINNNVEETNGPIGGTNGYEPGVIPITNPSDTGVWTVIFDFPTYQEAVFQNIQNSAPWNRIGNQPGTRTVVLSWDITVSSGGPGTDPNADLLIGRVYSNEYISLLHGNGVTTSPTFYVYTRDGYLYRVDFSLTDPYRFPISSNSLGLVDGNRDPIYLSKDETAFNRDADPDNWDPNMLYHYEPQAEDFEELINNKIFFNPPSPDLPNSATVTDLMQNNTHETWLNTEVVDFKIDTIYFVGNDPDSIGCSPGTLEFGSGGIFIFETNLDGEIELELDLNQNGIYSDSVDRVLTGNTISGVGGVLWDGLDGKGDSIMIGDFLLKYRGVVQYAEIHISMTDVENNLGGVTFELLNPPAGVNPNEFYYDHSDFDTTAAGVSGGGMPGDAMPTTIPYTYMGSFGNDRLLDQWFFIEYPIAETEINLQVIEDCPCDGPESTPEIEIVLGGGDFCEGDDVVLAATNTASNVTSVTYTWEGPLGYFFEETVGTFDTSYAIIPNISPIVSGGNSNNFFNSGTYTVTATSELGCVDGPDSLEVNVLPTPNITNVSGGGDYCEGDDVVLTAINDNPAVTQLTYTWTGPNGFIFSATVGGSDPLEATVSGITTANVGDYTLSVVGDNGCAADDITVTVNVNENPVLDNISGAGEYCLGDTAVLAASVIEPVGEIVNYTWTGPNGFFIQGSETVQADLTTDLTNLTTSLSGDYFLSVSTDAGCGLPDVSFNVNVNLIPEISNITGGGDYCDGETISLSAGNLILLTGDIIYTWTGPNGFMFSDTTVAAGPFPVDIPNAGVDASGDYTLTLTSLAGCTSVPQSVNVIVNPIAQISGITSGLFCIGTDVTLTATNNTPGITDCTYTWTGPNGFFFQSTSSNGQYDVTITGIELDDAGDYILTLTCDGGCDSEPDTASVAVTDGLELILGTQDGNICEGDDLVLTATNTVDAGDVDWIWTGPNGVVGSGTTGFAGPFTATVPNVGLNDSGDYIIEISSPNGCTAEPDTVSINVFSNLEITDISGGGTYCAGATVILTGTNNVVVDTVIYTWTGPNGFSFTDTTDWDGPFDLVLDNISLDQAGDYTLNITTPNGCPADPQTVTVEVNPSPVIDNITPDTVICSGQDLLLTAENSTPGLGLIFYTWIAPDGTEFSDLTDGGSFDWLITNIQTTGSGTYTLVLEADNGCFSDTAFVAVTVNASPEITDLTGDMTFCEGTNEEITLSGMNATLSGIDSLFYSWEGPNVVLDASWTTDIAGPFELTINTNDAASGIYTLTLVADNGCSDSETVTITINEQPKITDITPDTSVCMFTDLTLTAVDDSTSSSDIVSYTWIGPNGFSFTGMAPASGPFDVTLSNIMMSDAGEYCLTVTSAEGCVSEERCVNVEVKPTPVLEIVDGGAGAYCVGDTAIITIVNTTPGIDSLYFTCILADGSLVVSMAGGDDTLIVVLPDLTLGQSGVVACSSESFDGCISDILNLNIEVQAFPEIADITGGGDYCEGDEVNLSAVNLVSDTGPITYTWTGPNGVVFTGTVDPGEPFDATIPNIGLGDAGEYCLLLETSAGCASDTACVTVNVNPKPVLSAMNSDTTVCAGADVSLEINIDFPDSGTFDYECEGPNGTISGTVNAGDPIIIDLPNITIDDAGTYTCTVTSSEGCESDPISITVNVLPTPEIENISGGGDYCEGDDVTLSATNSVGGVGQITYTWTGPNGVVATGTTGPNGPFDATIPDITLNDAGEYCLTLESEAGCGSDEMCVTVNVNPLPIITNVSGDGVYCEGDLTMITADILLNGNSSVDWTVSGPGLDESGTATSDEMLSFDITVDGSTAGVYTITATSEDGCEADVQTVNIELNDVPTPTLTAEPNPICEGDEITLTSSDLQGQVVTYEWFFNGNSIGTSDAPVFVVQAGTTGEYSVVATVDGCNSEVSASVVVDVIPAPTANDDAYSLAFNNTLSGVNVLDNDLTGNGVTVTVVSGPSNGMGTIDASGNLEYTPTLYFEGTDQIVYEICDLECPDNCDQATVTITINPAIIEIPNVITPNGDGDNDMFMIDGLKNNAFPESVLQIFNRWGDEIYIAEPYNNDWEGTHEDKPLPAGTYFYLLRLRPDRPECHQGFVTIVR